MHLFRSPNDVGLIKYDAYGTKPLSHYLDSGKLNDESYHVSLMLTFVIVPETHLWIVVDKIVLWKAHVKWHYNHN